MNKVVAAVMPAPLQPVELREFAELALERGSILLRTIYSEVCGTDVHLWHGRLAGVPYPIDAYVEVDRSSGEWAIGNSGIRYSIIVNSDGTVRLAGLTVGGTFDTVTMGSEPDALFTANGPDGSSGRARQRLSGGVGRAVHRTHFV